MKNIPKFPKNRHFKLFLAVFGVILAIFGHFSTVFGEKSLPGLPWDDPPPELWFPVGEVIEYDVLWGLFTVGEATASAAWTNRDGRRLLTLIVEAETNGIVDKLYPVKEYLETILDPVTFLPLSFEKRSREGRRHYDEITTFDHERLEGHWKSLTKNTEKIFPIKPDTRDLMGLMYWIRKTPIQAGETHHYEVMTDEKLYGVVVEAGKKEKVSLKRYGKVKCIKMEPKGTFDGMFVRKGRLWLWLSDDERYTICRAAASVPVASIKIMLKRVRGPGDDFWVAPR
ncbi:MAG: DUF3108 domain-containing protein [Kiritimatiellae bacterium]|nr:DUF3108 domain-containing protein [Kiritimatiellia bacterium]MDD4340875.1 DUF3108 domain-containing protein [Kiritimatiellia bacterium]